MSDLAALYRAEVENNIYLRARVKSLEHELEDEDGSVAYSRDVLAGQYKNCCNTLDRISMEKEEIEQRMREMRKITITYSGCQMIKNVYGKSCVLMTDVEFQRLLELSKEQHYD